MNPKVIPLKHDITDEQAREALAALHWERVIKAGMAGQKKAKRGFDLSARVGWLAMAFTWAYIAAQYARGLVNGWAPGIDPHTQAVAGGAIVGALAVLGLGAVAVGVWLAVRKSGR